jgi:hypothetical protein
VSCGRDGCKVKLSLSSVLSYLSKIFSDAKAPRRCDMCQLWRQASGVHQAAELESDCIYISLLGPTQG